MALSGWSRIPAGNHAQPAVQPPDRVTVLGGPRRSCSEVVGDGGQAELAGPALLGALPGQVIEDPGGLADAAAVRGQHGQDARTGVAPARCSPAWVSGSEATSLICCQVPP